MQASPIATAMFGLLALAAAMGIGRFAFTPLLPLMQADGLSLADGAWLASSNYLGYLFGALFATFWPPAPQSAIRAGLSGVALTTLLMAFGHGLPGWLLLRLLAGIASAYVLVGVSTWSLAIFAAVGRPALAGWVFAGVGIGILLAGLVALATAASGTPPDIAWAGLGLLALAVLVSGWQVWQPVAILPVTGAAVADSHVRVGGIGRAGWALVIAYGGFGFGYIIPATFIPAAARALVDDPMVFGWAWPLFGLAAALSTVLVSLGRSIAPRRIAIGSLLVMVAGVLLPVLMPGLVAILISAVCVGGTFVVMTMAGIQQSRRLASGAPTRLVAAMTAAFAFGQLVGPMLVAGGSSASDAIVMPSLIASGVLLLSILLLAFQPDEPGRS